MNREDNKIYDLFKNELLNNLIKYILIFLTIILSRDTLITSIKLGFNKSFIFYVIAIFIVIVLLFSNNKGNIKIKVEATRNILVFIGILAIVSIIKLDFQLYIMSIIFYISVAYLFIYLFKFDEFFQKLSNIMCVLAVISLISLYCLKGILFPGGIVNANMPIVANIENLKFFDLGLSYVVAFPYYMRNFGVFREPGVYQFFLLIPLIYELLLNKNNLRYINIAILSITIISTFSLVGICVLGIVITVHILKLALEKRMTKKNIYILLMIAFLFIIVVYSLYLTNYSFKSIIKESFKKAVTINESTSTRGLALERNLKLFLKSPILGNDFSNVNNEFAHNTTSTLSIFAIFGLFSGILHVLFQLEFARKVSSNKLIVALTFIGVMLMINTQFLLGNTLFWVFTFSVFMSDVQQDSRYLR
ncbi:MAG: hypothetical protein ACLSV2_03630 [Clostridium sp.]